MNNNLIFWIFRIMYRTSPILLFFVLLLDTLLAITPAISIFIMQKLFNISIESSIDYSIIYTVILFILISLFIPRSFSIITQILREFIQKKTQVYITENILQVASNVSMSKIEDTTITGYFQTYQNTVFLIIRITSIVIVLFSFNWWLPIIALFSITPFFFSNKRNYEDVNQHMLKQAELERHFKYFFDVLSEPKNAGEIKTYNNYFWLKRNWEHWHNIYDNNGLRFIKKFSIRNGLYEIPIPFLLTTIRIIVFYSVYIGLVTIGAAIAFSQALNDFQDTIANLISNIKEITKQTPKVRLTREFLINTSDKTTDYKLKEVNGPFDIEFVNVSFKYSNTNNFAIKNVSFHIKKGEKVVLVGENGSGKSTLIRLLLNLNQPCDGKILIDGISLNKLNDDKYKKHISACFQDYSKYLLTCEENIGLGQIENMTNKKIIASVMEKSDVIHFVNKLPNGMQQRLGVQFKNGIDISEGQWQKLAIGRAYFKKANLFVMDEPTASVDPETEFDIYKKYLDISENKTSIMVSHRLGSAVLADKVMLLKNGELIDFAHHNELIRYNELYREMYQSQSTPYIENIY